MSLHNPEKISNRDSAKRKNSQGKSEFHEFSARFLFAFRFGILIIWVNFV
jgi:hypothetical protein